MKSASEAMSNKETGSYKAYRFSACHKTEDRYSFDGKHPIVFLEHSKANSLISVEPNCFSLFRDSYMYQPLTAISTVF